MGVALVLFTPLLIIFYTFLRRAQDLWWLYTGIVLFFFSVIMARLAPVIIFPLFYKFRPLQEKDLETRLRKAAARVGLEIKGLFGFDMSKNTKKANAGLAGLGKSRRIIIGDTLLENFSHDEIESVFCHELGHHKYRHILKQMALGTFFTFAGLYITHIAIMRAIILFKSVNPAYGGLDDVALLPLFALFLTLFGLVLMPLQNAISRRFEYESDNYAVREGPDRAHFVSAMNKLAEQNLADREPHPIVEFLFYSHPAIKRRIQAVENVLKYQVN
jgi:STE24 endopeptidase